MYDLLSRGGGLMYPILFCSVLAFAIFLQRFYTFTRFQKGNRELNAKLQPLIHEEEQVWHRYQQIRLLRAYCEQHTKKYRSNAFLQVHSQDTLYGELFCVSHF